VKSVDKTVGKDGRKTREAPLDERGLFRKALRVAPRWKA
jgi:hypothetical protein